MPDWLHGVEDYFSVVSESNTSIGIHVAALLIVGGMLPPLGPGRAFTLAFKSYFKITPSASKSISRTSDIDRLNSSIQSFKWGSYSYMVVIGENGIGRTRLVDTALDQHFGVVKLSVSSYINIIIG